jgi:hypothetical protein
MGEVGILFFLFHIHLVFSFSGYSVGRFLFYTGCESLREGLYYSFFAIEILEAAHCCRHAFVLPFVSTLQIFVRCRYFCTFVGSFESISALLL